MRMTVIVFCNRTGSDSRPLAPPVSCLDGFPELPSVLRCEVRLAGSRSLLTEYASLYLSEQNRRHKARSGITGEPRLTAATSLAGWPSCNWTCGNCPRQLVAERDGFGETIV